MKKHTQRQLLGLLKSIVKGVTYIKENAQTNQTETVYNDCNAAINMVRKTVEAELSEQGYMAYAELFDKVMKALGESTKIQEEVARRQLLDEVISALHDLDRTLHSETEINKEIVFFPYKASMWDSLESIWKAAMEDPRCDCYVVPIPYYSNGKMEFEGHLFPKDVPVVHYSLYKMEVQQPDVTYIHNPYDDTNMVTMVSSQYFSGELKKHTNMLVYVPYFVSDNEIREHFCQLSSLKNIDLIVVQSEKIREAYLKFQPAEKVVALGSPKFDKVIYNQENGVEIPSIWKEKITGKKVVLYNTSLGAMLMDTKSYLEKMLYVFESFKKNRDIVLLWRPHPLMKSTIQSMRPLYVNTYNQIEQFFIQNDLGILDLEPDFHVAIAVSDAYYGDGSSLVPLFAATGKPIVIQNLLTDDDLNKKTITLRFETIAVKDEKTIYGFTDEYNALFEVDLESGKAKYLGSVPNMPFISTQVSIGMEIIGDRIIIAPYYTNPNNLDFKIIEYSLTSRRFVEKDLLSKDIFEAYLPDVESDLLLFNSIIKFEKYAFFIPCQYGAIVEYNTEDDSCILHPIPEESLKSKRKVSKRTFLPFGHIEGNCFYMPMLESNWILKFSLDTREFQWIQIGGRDANYSSCYCDSGNLWLASFVDGSLTKFNLATSRVEKKYKLSPKGVKFNSQGTFFGDIIDGGEGKLVALPRFSRKAIAFSKASGKSKESTLFLTAKHRDSKQYSRVTRFGNKTYVMNWNTWELLIYDYEEKNLDCKKITLKASDEETLLNAAMNSDLSAVDDSESNPTVSELLKSEHIARYLEKIISSSNGGVVNSHRKYLQSRNANVNGTSGANIHQCVLDKL